jgi:hypothetical protein
MAAGLRGAFDLVERLAASGFKFLPQRPHAHDPLPTI